MKRERLPDNITTVKKSTQFVWPPILVHALIDKKVSIWRYMASKCCAGTIAHPFLSIVTDFRICDWASNPILPDCP
jgi:hypothetical protein